MMQSIIFYSAAVVSSTVSPETKVAATLDSFHKAAAEAKFEPYFAHFTRDGIFIGTDVSERWTVEEFKAYVRPHFSKGKGWTYIPKARHIAFNPEKTTAWFDEVLDNPKYGTARGTGVLLLENAEWKIAQYHLTFPIPNDLAGSFTEQIKAHEAKSKVKQPPKADQ